MRRPRILFQSKLPTRTSFASAVSSLLCLSMAAPVSAFAAPAKPGRVARNNGPKATMDSGQKVLHALNRFTFGPTPGGEAEVNRIGLNAWFERQLHPERITDTALAARLAAFPAMQLTQAELLQRFPSPGMLRQYSNGKLDAPADPMERTIYADAAFTYDEKRELRKEAALKQSAAMVGAPTTPVAPEMAAKPAAALSAPDAQKSNSAPAMDDAMVRAILALPTEARMARLTAMTPEEMQALRGALKGNAEGQLTQGMSPIEKEEVAAMQAPLRVVGTEALATRLLRDVYSERQLQAVLTDFWLNHFNVYDRKDQDEPYLLPAYEREAILPHALGHFEDLLVATAQSPAMLRYLDNWTSIGPNSKAGGKDDRPTIAGSPLPASAAGSAAPISKGAKKQAKGINENYARELMELHTLGVNGGYTQNDVIEVAKCFTGWTLNSPTDGGGFRFDPSRHEPGPKTVLGHTIGEAGENEGLEVLHLLATSPRAAHFISLELAQRFVSDTPPPALVERMTAAYLRSDGDISAVLSAMFHAPQFWSGANYWAKVKTPLEFVASALRASDADVTNPMPLLGAMNRLGMPVYGMQTPNGYSWQADAWVSTNSLVTRMNFALTFSGNHLPGTRVDWAQVLGPAQVVATEPDAPLEAALERAILDQPANLKTRQVVLAQAADPSTESTAAQSFRALPVKAQADSTVAEGAMYTSRAPQPGTDGKAATRATTMAGLLLGSPDFQRR